MDTITQPRHPIKAVARRTGLTTHAIRAWEKRYQALTPQRTPSNRRLYSESDIERLTLLKRAAETGHNIGQIAKLTNEELQGMIAVDSTATGSALRTVKNDTTASIEFHIQESLAAVRELNGERLDLTLRRAAVALSQPVLLESVIIPLMDRIGHSWEVGEMRVAHEHLATAIVRNFLGTIAAGYQPPPNAPVLVVGTPVGQTHELGAVLSAVTAMSAGWRVVYLGADMPAHEFIHVAQASKARAVALSLIYPPDDSRVTQELAQLSQMLSPHTDLIIGGRAASSYLNRLQQVELYTVATLSELRSLLAKLRQSLVG